MADATGRDDERDVRDEVVRLLGEYGFIMDRRAWHRLGEVFTEDGVFDATALGVPRCAGLAAMRERFASMDHPIAHHVTNIVVAEPVGADRAVHSKYLGPVRGGRVISGEYWDTFRRVADGWRIVERVVVPRVPDAQTLSPPTSWQSL